MSPLPSRDEMAETLEDRVAQAIDNVTFGYAGGQRPPDELEDLTREVIALVAEHIAQQIEAHRDSLGFTDGPYGIAARIARSTASRPTGEANDEC